MFVVEGIRATEELARSPLAIEGVLAAPKLGESPRGVALRDLLVSRDVPISDVTDREFASATETDSPQGVLAVVRIPERSLNDLRSSPVLRLLVLDAVQDPGNVGTMLRTAAAMGASAAIALPGTVDVWNAKVVRSAMGAHFHFLAFHTTWSDLQAFLQDTGTALWGADTSGTPLPDINGIPQRLALAVGNEGAGLSAELKPHIAQVVSIPLAAVVESLNVAVATGILLYELRA